MTCAHHSITRTSIALLVVATLAAPARAQQPPAPLPVPLPTPSSPSSTADALAPYRAPRIALAQPAAAEAGGGGSVPQDRPVVVFRFAAGEPDDPLDVRSLAVAVDGTDRTALFQTTATPAGGQAWGPLADDAAIRRGQLAAGVHRVVARICSTRGACGTTEVQVLVVPGLTASGGASADEPKSAARRVLGAVLTATRKLLLP